MILKYDKEVDALSIIFKDTTVTTKSLAEGIAADFDADGKLVGLEILDAAGRFGDVKAFTELELDGMRIKAA